MNISSERKIVSAAKELIEVIDKYLGNHFWHDIERGAEEGNPVCVAFIKLRKAVNGN